MRSAEILRAATRALALAAVASAACAGQGARGAGNDGAPSADAGPPEPRTDAATGMVAELVPLCHLEAPTTCPEPAVRYAQIGPIVEQLSPRS